jgi:protein-S-isoprenylcysteine O-methyltransferase Ste14
VPSFVRIAQFLPVGVVIWMAFGAGIIFSPNAGRRDPRGFVIGLGLWGVLASIRASAPPPLWMVTLGIAGLLTSLALFQWAALSIRGRLFSFAGNDDLPQFVHRSGPYAYVRNPFYASYLLAEVSTVVMWPSIWGAALVLTMLAYFQWLTRYEEEKFSRSPVAAEYAEYKAQTGRLLPRFRGAGLVRPARPG